MTQANLVKKISAISGLSQVDAKKALDGLVEVIENVELGDVVAIAGLGKFKLKERAARTGRNPLTGDALEIPACEVLKFKMSPTLQKSFKEV